MSKISVIFPVRPNCKTLQTSLLSITSQTYTDWQVVAILDRDSGENEKLIRELIPVNKLKVVNTNYLEVGFPQMLNLGVQVSDSEFIARLDDDDISCPDRFELQTKILGSNPKIGLVTGWAKVVDGLGDVQYWIKPFESSQDIKNQLLKINSIPHSSVMLRRKIFDEVGGYRSGMNLCEDYDLWLRLVRHTEFYGVQKQLITYFNNPSGMTKKRIEVSVITELRKSRIQAQKYCGVGFLKRAVQNYLWEKMQ